LNWVMVMLQVLLWWSAAVGHKRARRSRHMRCVWRASCLRDAVDAARLVLFAAGLQRSAPFRIRT
jgi:hypothetical protein